MNLSVIKKINTLFVLITFVCVGLFSQSKNDAINAFNQGVVMMKTDPESAIEPFENCIKICEQVGDSADEVKIKAVQVLPDLYFQKAYNLFSTDKKYQESLTASKIALGVAEKYDNQKTKEKTQKLMIQDYSTLGINYYTANDNEKALSCFDSVLMINPDYLNAIKNKALTYIKLNNTAKFTETIDNYIVKLKDTNDTNLLPQANKIALDYFRNSGVKANAAKKYPEALTLLNSSFKYGTDKVVYYQLANIYNTQKKYTEAAENAQKGLELETGAPEVKARYYWELGVAQAGKGQTTDACESFKNSMYGQFLDASKAQRTNLKCK
jgi:tetratricopeptide (TPR) repeat protein